MPVESAADLLMALLYAPGKTGETGEEIRGITRMEKLVFLLAKEGGFEAQVGAELSFAAYDFGPYSGTVVDVIDALRGEELVRATEVDSVSLKEVADGLIAASVTGEGESAQTNTVLEYGLTERGRRVGQVVFESLSTIERSSIVEVKSRFNSLRLSDLLEYVYKRYPKMVQKSKILDQVLGFGTRPSLPSPDIEE